MKPLNKKKSAIYATSRYIGMSYSARLFVLGFSKPDKKLYFGEIFHQLRLKKSLKLTSFVLDLGCTNNSLLWPGAFAARFKSLCILFSESTFAC